ncbi:hypothetical protein [Massilia sp. HP4]|uniref:hypothetical protein n=1 Tax=Massilia sp. HP4 TaxID=2562316 RepID=UPI0010C03CE5|nr:hypothetical protein [Massilia sp. HP4]
MGLMGILGFFVVVGGLIAMSTTSRVFMTILFGASIYYWQSISAVLHGGNGPSLDELKMAMTLLSANIGGFIVATVLGVLKSDSGSDRHYREKRKVFLIFLAKWGSIYAAYAYICGKLIDWGYGEEGIGWFFMRAWGVYGFIVLLVLWFVFKPRKQIHKA